MPTPYRTLDLEWKGDHVTHKQLYHYLYYRVLFCSVLLCSVNQNMLNNVDYSRKYYCPPFVRLLAFPWSN
jgi:hypothetical protein